jgi:hypothetical protein
MPASGASVKITVERPLRLNFAVTDGAHQERAAEHLF